MLDHARRNAQAAYVMALELAHLTSIKLADQRCAGPDNGAPRPEQLSGLLPKGLPRRGFSPDLPRTTERMVKRCGRCTAAAGCQCRPLVAQCHSFVALAARAQTELSAAEA